MNSAAPVGGKCASDQPLGAPVYGGVGAGILKTPFIPIGTTVLNVDTAPAGNVPELPANYRSYLSGLPLLGTDFVALNSITFPVGQSELL